ncbi:MAG: TPM domain-containing protein [Methylovirgula sp.]
MVADRARALLATRSARAILAIAALVCVWAFAQVAVAYTFPALTGRVVDQANIIPDATRQEITQKLADLEQKSGIQLVVATVNSLEDGDIETYANELFRTWKLGEKDKNNGVLLLVAPNEHKVRIEVGYGLEGTLTDALSKLIIINAMTPRFKAGDFGGGISRGVDDIITVLTTDSSQWQPRLQLRADADKNSDDIGWVLLGGIIILVVLLGVSPGFRWFFFNVLLSMLLSSGSSRGGGFSGGGSWGDGGGGFSGGGGSSGGGGASGGW